MPAPSSLSPGFEGATLRARFTLLFGFLMILYSGALLLYFNVATHYLISREATLAATEFVIPVTPVLVHEATPTPIPYQPSALPNQGTLLLPATVLQELRVLSLMGFGVLVVTGMVSTYWLAGQALNPLKAMSHLTRKISAGTLNRRLPLPAAKDELRELATSFNVMLSRLETAFEQQRRFVGDAAHELRTPLASLRANLEIVLYDEEATVADYRDTARILEAVLGNLEHLVATLLILATGEPLPHAIPTSIVTLVDEVIEESRPLGTPHQVSIRFREPQEDITVLAHPVLLKRALTNLLENAIYYNRPDGWVEVHLECDAASVTVSVTDTGIGIPIDVQPQIFQRFFRSDEARRYHRDGNGLGLALVHHITLLHHGTIDLNSHPGSGSTFRLRLPIHPRDGGDGTAPTPPQN